MRAPNSLPSTLDALLRNRFHGAVNIRGIRYQLLYSLSRALELFDSQCQFDSISLEAIEDVDLNAPQLRSLQLAGEQGARPISQFVQVKTSETPWPPSKLKDVVPNFLELLGVSPDAQCVLAFNFVPQGDIAIWAGYRGLRGEAKGRAKVKFRTLVCSCQDSHGRARGFTNAQADALLERLQILSVPEANLQEQLRRLLAVTFELHSDIVDTYLSLFTDRLMEWAIQRSTVRREDLSSIHERLVLNSSRQKTFEAYGRSLIGHLEWREDAQQTDFLEGKMTRPGHVVANLDVPRPYWQQRIGEVLRTGGVAIVRASSGQGKSTLAYRFTYDQWPDEHTFLLRSVQTADEAGQVTDFLRFRCQTLQFPTFLLIDNAGRQTSQWPLVAREAAALGVKVLVTLRQEDWYRFMREGMFGYDVIEPTLDLQEAEQIYATLEKRGHIRTELAAAQAFERIGEPRLLMEYVFLLTTGQMLFDRLRDQIQGFRNEREDPLKREILRRVSLADVLGAPVNLNELLRDLASRLRDDPQDVIESLCREYLRLDQGNLHGLHWVRSDHLVKLLHGDIISPSQTAIQLIPLVSHADLASFVANALSHPLIDRDALMAGLIKSACEANIPTLLAYLEGAFEAGERHFLLANKAVFDQSYDLAGANGPFLLVSAYMPVLSLDTLAVIARMRPGSQGDELFELSKKAVEASRGRDFCHELLLNVQSGLPKQTLISCPLMIGRFLIWSAFTGVSIGAWSAMRTDLIDNSAFDLPLSNFQEFAFGLWRYDRTAYSEWFERWRDDLIPYLQWQTNSLEVKVEDWPNDESGFSVRFLVNGEDSDSTHKKNIERLNTLYCALPFCQHLRSQGVWPLGLAPSPDPTYKDGPTANFPVSYDVEKNVIWRRVVEAAYSIDTYYDFQKSWFELRQLILQFAELLTKAILGVVERGSGSPFGPHLSPNGLLERLERASSLIPEPPSQTPEDISHDLKDFQKGAKGWESAVSAFLITLRNIPEEVEQGQKSPGHLAWHNCHRIFHHLAGLHNAFDQLFTISADYFNAQSLKARENEIYEQLALAIDAWLKNPLPSTQKRGQLALVLRKLREAKSSRQQELLDGMRLALYPLEERGFKFVYPSGIAVDFPLTSIPLGFEVADPCFPEPERNEVLEALVAWSQNLSEPPTYFILLPLFQGSLYLEYGLKPLARFPKDNDVEEWQRYLLILDTPHKITPTETQVLPSLPRRHFPRVQIFQGLVDVGSRLQNLAELRGQLDSVLGSSHQFDQKFANDLDLFLQELTKTLREAVFKVVEAIQANLPAPSTDLPEGLPDEYSAAYSYIEAVLKVAIVLCNAQRWLNLPVGEQDTAIFSLERMNQAAQMLLKSAPQSSPS